MKVWRYNDNPDHPELTPGDAPIPHPGPGEVLIQVAAAGVTPTEIFWHPTTHERDGTPRRAAILSHEFSGVVTETGEGATHAAGTAVFGMNDWFADGALAEYVVAPSSSVIPKPEGLSFAEAATVPIGALTAWQGLKERAKLLEGERFLIHGAAGAVGIFAVQLARSQGAEVFAVASGRHRELLQQLGADHVIDYHNEHFEQVATKIDVVFDTVGGYTLARSRKVLSPQGRMVTVAAESEGREDWVRPLFFIVEPNAEQLTEIAHRLEDGRLKTVLGLAVPFPQAAHVITSPRPVSQSTGKLVVTMH